MNQIFESRQIRGSSRGRLLGFPTINLVIPELFRLDYGIYAARVSFGGKTYWGALHFGPIPVFEVPTPSLEVFIIDADEAVFSDQLIEHLTIEVQRFIRSVMNFPNAQALTVQIARDVEAVRTIAE